MKSIGLILISAVSLFLGILGTWIYFHIQSGNPSFSKSDLHELLANVSVEIPDNAFSCDLTEKTIAAVLVGRDFIHFNSGRISNTEFNCDTTECRLVVSNCKPWQSSDCGQTFLRYKIDSQRKMIAASLECLDTP